MFSSVSVEIPDMPSQRLRLVTTTVFSKLQQFLARSFALSLSLNRRNIEHDWYAFWNHVLLDMVKDTRNLIVCPQYVVWVAPEGLLALNDGVQDIGPESDPETSDETPQTHGPASNRPQTRSMTLKQLELDAKLKNLRAETKETVAKAAVETVAVEDSSDPVPEVVSSPANVSIPSNPSMSSTTGSVGTISLPKDSSTRIVDFAILKVLEGENPPPDPVNAEDVEAKSVEVKAIVEIKRFASRNLRDEALKARAEIIINNATGDVAIQAALLFEKYEELDSIIAIVASGHYWSHTVLRPNNINPGLLEKIPINLEYNDKYVAAVWPPAVALDDVSSWRKLRELFKKIRA